MARKDILLPSVLASDPPKNTDVRPKPAARSAVGSLQSSLAKLQENAVQEIDPDLIDDAGYEDRLGVDETADARLRENIQVYGQQVPVLLRPHPEAKGRYEIVYGRRRLRALRALGLYIKALVRQLDDHALVIAQGQENNARQDLTFIERAAFAAQLEEAGYDRPTIASALSTDEPMVSRFLKIGRTFDLPLLRQIGSAPGVGRDRWMVLAQAFAQPEIPGRLARLLEQPDVLALDSNGRFDAVFKLARGTVSSRGPVTYTEPVTFTTVGKKITGAQGEDFGESRLTHSSLNWKIGGASPPEFRLWMDEHAEALICELHARWQAARSEDGKETTRRHRKG